MKIMLSKEDRKKDETYAILTNIFPLFSLIQKAL